MSSFAFMRANQQRCDRDWTIFVMVDPNFQATSVRWCAMAWYAQSCCGRFRGAAKGDVEPTEAAKSPASIQLEHFEVWMAERLLAVSVCVCVRAAESRFVVILEGCGVRRGRNEFGWGYWHRVDGLSSCAAPNRCTRGTQGEILRFHALKPAEM